MRFDRSSDFRGSGKLETSIKDHQNLAMPITIEIPEHLFDRIQKQAIPFIDLTPASVIERWADFFETSGAGKPIPVQVPEPAPPVVEGKRFNPINPPELFHTRVNGQIAGKAFNKWNDLVRLAHILAFAKARSLEELRSNTRANVQPGNLAGKDGFHFVPELGASIQGLDANKAWECSLRLAKYAGLPLRVQFSWRDNPKAAFPGETGVLEWLPEV